ncbi:hypothetical protein [Dokdonia sp. Hel_I_53]|uniref:hypothetical protein n=1 Tax=Dokdonia sp. Hel_I_53 TaxID=1566287 RepID=UPI00119A94AB|nr:hypothetical protein [Dokdonia sp. Hel_I_53]TVZ51826.1 hypothetical protein OD90_0980 [Dokdonia sp. Hel_I_53]
MKKIFTVCLLIAITISCDDGDVTITEFDFDQTIELCSTPDNNQYVFYNTNDANEGIAVQFTTTEDILSEEITEPNFAIIDSTYSVRLDGGQDRVVYRKFKSAVTNNYFCNIIPPSEPIVDNELISYSTDLSIKVTGFMDDNDGIPAEVEDPDGYNSTNIGDMKDTDLDGIPNIYDDDDDGDNVPTRAEYVADQLDNLQDSDEDTIPDYLDDDDDGDGVLTRYEDANGDLNPMNDNSDVNNPTKDDYLNAEIAVTTVVDSFRIHNFRITDRSVFILMQNLSYENATETVLNREEQILGTYSVSEDLEITFTPNFN